MDYISTRNANLRVSAAQAIASGIAPDGRLYCPAEIPALTPADLESFMDLDYKTRAADILGRFLEGFLQKNCKGLLSRHMLMKNLAAQILRRS